MINHRLKVSHAIFQSTHTNIAKDTIHFYSGCSQFSSLNSRKSESSCKIVLHYFIFICLTNKVLAYCSITDAQVLIVGWHLFSNHYFKLHDQILM